MGSCCSEKNKSCCCEVTPKAVQVSTKLSLKDVIGTWKARWGINRMNYKVDPGLYCVGQPDTNSPVLVTANYKMSFDVLRKELTGISAWILVLDTKGINVWCAAGKGTFGTEEIIKRIEFTGLSEVIEHRTVILPQLGAVGVSAHEVQKTSGFKVVYGPVRAEDVPLFLKNGMKADKEMRRVRFNFIDRTVLTPIEIVGTVKPSLIIFGIMFLLNLIGVTRFTGTDVYSYMGAVFVGCLLVPMLLPWIPGRAFSFKGWLLGLAWAGSVSMINGYFVNIDYNILTGIAYLLILPSVSAYGAMNFTGCSTYTSFSGVMKEMKLSIPLIAVSIGLGIVLLLAGNLMSVLS
ncbi:MAG: mercury methylation corrinoid protein HgcA [Bacillota bacterium]